jgi:hypothetical protein
VIFSGIGPSLAYGRCPSIAALKRQPTVAPFDIQRLEYATSVPERDRATRVFLVVRCNSAL